MIYCGWGYPLPSGQQCQAAAGTSVLGRAAHFGVFELRQWGRWKVCSWLLQASDSGLRKGQENQETVVHPLPESKHNRLLLGRMGVQGSSVQG